MIHHWKLCSCVLIVYLRGRGVKRRAWGWLSNLKKRTLNIDLSFFHSYLHFSSKFPIWNLITTLPLLSWLAPLLTGYCRRFIAFHCSPFLDCPTSFVCVLIKFTQDHLKGEISSRMAISFSYGRSLLLSQSITLSIRHLLSAHCFLGWGYFSLYVRCIPLVEVWADFLGDYAVSNGMRVVDLPVLS